MNTLPVTTQRRLQQLPQIPSVWEGDRRPLGHLRGTSEGTDNGEGECIIWVDGSEGFVRAMDIVSPEMGLDAVVRTLLRAIEQPHSPAQPARPKKIVVRNREIQFFLRGALQSLDIVIDYEPELPLIDELFRSFEAVNNARPPAIPAEYEGKLTKSAMDIWNAAPWDVMADYDIIGIDVQRWGIETVYACVMGMLGQEYGIIFYRSLESLKQFRMAALTKQASEQLEKAFLAQDCWFLNFEAKDYLDDEDEDDFDLGDLASEDIHPLFGSVHPFEGIRPFLDEAEASTLYHILQAFFRFFVAHQDDLEENVEAISKRYRFTETCNGQPETFSLRVFTLPDLTAEFLEMLEMAEDAEDEDEEDEDDEDTRLRLPIRDDLVPENSFLSLGMVPWELLETLQTRHKTYYQSQDVSPQGEGMPVVMIQTSRPKAKDLIETLKASNGVKAICFNPGEDPFDQTQYDLGILQTGDGDLYLFGEFIDDDPEHQQARRKWDYRCQTTQGCCGLIIAMGITGSSRGTPQISDMLAFFETRCLEAKDLAMGVLKLMPMLDQE